MATDRLRLLVGGLLVASAALFAVGVAIERHDTSRERGRAGTGVVVLADADTGHRETPGSDEQTAPPTTAQPSHRSETKPEARAEPHGGEQRPEGGREAAGGESAAHRAAERGNERVFGIDTESTGLVIAAVAVSLLLVAGLWILPQSLLLLLAIVGFGLVAAVFDVREVFHQIDESRTNLIVIAGVVAGLHLATAAGGGALVARRRRGLQGPAESAAG